MDVDSRTGTERFKAGALGAAPFGARVSDHAASTQRASKSVDKVEFTLEGKRQRREKK